MTDMSEDKMYELQGWCQERSLKAAGDKLLLEAGFGPDGRPFGEVPSVQYFFEGKMPKCPFRGKSRQGD